MVRTTTGGRISGIKGKGQYQDNIARAEIANKANANLVIRIHSDAGTAEGFYFMYPEAIFNITLAYFVLLIACYQYICSFWLFPCM